MLQMDVFLEKSLKGGSFPIQKFSLQIFCIRNGIFWSYILEKMSKKGGKEGVISNPKKIIANLRKLMYIYDFFCGKSAMKKPKIGRGGGGSKAKRPFGFWSTQAPLISNARTYLDLGVAYTIKPNRSDNSSFYEPGGGGGGGVRGGVSREVW